MRLTKFTAYLRLLGGATPALTEHRGAGCRGGERREAGGERREARGERRKARGGRREAEGERREARGERRKACLSGGARERSTN